MLTNLVILLLEKINVDNFIFIIYYSRNDVLCDT